MKSIKTKILATTLTIQLLSLALTGGVAAVMNYRSTVKSLEQTMSEAVVIAANRVDAELNGYRMLAQELAESNEIAREIPVQNVMAEVNQPDSQTAAEANEQTADTGEEQTAPEENAVEPEGETAAVEEAGQTEADMQPGLTAESVKAEMISNFRDLEQRHGFSIAGRTDAQGISLETGASVADQDYFTQAKQTGQPYISDPVTQKDNGSMNMYVSAPIMKDGVFDGVLYFGLDADFLCNIVAGISIGGTGNAAILDKNGTSIGYADKQIVLDAYNTQNEVKSDPKLKRLAAIEREMMAGNTGFADYSYGGADKYMAYTSIPNTNGWSIDISVMQNELLNSTIASIVITIVIVLITLIIASFIIIRLSVSIVDPIRKCVDRIRTLANGDLNSPVPVVDTKDETGVLALSTKGLVEELSNVISDVTNMLGQMSEGNLNVESAAEYKGDLAPIQTAALKIIESLNHDMAQIGQSSDEVASSSDQVASAAQGLSQGATEQASSVEELAATINDISGQVKQNADNALAANDRVKLVGTEMMESNRQMQEMIAAMTEISASSSEIGKIIKTIEDIAFQTNILALNAAVEAARAGAAGKGFAVVADEVRNLASKSAEASKNTAALIENSIHSVENGTRIADLTAQSLQKAAEGADEVVVLIEKITDASEEQASSIMQVTQGVDQIASVVQTNSATAEESAAASEELSGQAQVLKDLVGKFKLKGQETVMWQQEETVERDTYRPTFPTDSYSGKY